MGDEGKVREGSVLNHVMDAVDIETFLVCENETEGKGLALRLLHELGFRDGDIVSISYRGVGARVRLRGTIHKPGDRYHWDREIDDDQASDVTA
ncbi:MAG: hypothetical protein ACE5JI_03750 [Acidobacteriota bacterium]